MGLETSMGSPNRGVLPPHYSSLYNQTLGEIQNQLGHPGKPVNGVNLDALLKSVIAVDDNQVLQNAASSSSSNSIFSGNYNLNGVLSRSKTVDEALQDIVDGEQGGAGTLGGLTLEEFLICTGTMNPQPLMAVDPIVAAAAAAEASTQGDWLPYPMDVMGSVAAPVFVDPVSLGYADCQLALTVPMVGPTSSEPMVGSERKRRVSVEILEKTIERRQKRMIKNRESAARSRARKQAYAVKLDEDLRGWTAANQRLKELMELEMRLDSEIITEPKYQLRRSSSANF